MNRRLHIIVLAAALVVGVSAVALSQPRVTESAMNTYSSEQARFRLVQILDGLHHPWSFAFLPDGAILITERAGSLWLVEGRRVAEVSGVPEVAAVGQGGLLDLALHPEFTANRVVFFSFSDRYRFGLGTAVARARLEGDRLRDVEVIFRMNRSSAGGRHFGSRLAVGPDGLLYVTVGDRGQQDRAQDPNDHAGSVLRVGLDGSIPRDNPFVDGRRGAAELFSYGHRNPQGMTVNPESGDIWLHEHGPQGGDEINIVKPAANYGWPVITYGVNYGTGTPIGESTRKPGMEQPLTHWSPSIAPSGMTFYTGDRFPEWRGDLFVGALAGAHLRRVEVDGDRVVAQEVLLARAVGRIRDVREGPDGHLYLITDERNGGLYRLEAVE